MGENISPEEFDIIKNLHLRGRGINIIAHCPQIGGGCHPFIFLRGVFPNETYHQAYERVKPDILRYIAEACGRSCMCAKNGAPSIWYTLFGGI